MPYNERTNTILKILKEQKRATVEDLAKTLYVSPTTIRRDLSELQKSGQVKRTHGGVIYVDETDEISIFIRQTKNAREKSQVADIAVSHLPDFQTVFFDNSSTCLALCEKLDLRHKTVVTNGLQIAMHAAKHDNVNIIIPGGEVKFNTTAVLGSLAANNLRQFNFDLAIVSCSALNSEGTYELGLETMQIKRIAMSQASNRVLLFDRSKINSSATFCSGTLESYNLLVTNASDHELLPLKQRNPTIRFINK